MTRSLDFKKFIHVTFQWPGIHYWPDAPEAQSFLRHHHRHLFHGKITLEVDHGDREVEYFELLHWLAKESTAMADLEFMNQLPQKWSCEFMAEKLLRDVLETYGHQRSATVEVWEDNENGGSVTWGG